MRVDGPDGKPKAIVVNFGTHPTLLGAGNFEISAEWPGALQRELARDFPGAVVLYTNGAEGDQAPAGAEGNTAFQRAPHFVRPHAQQHVGVVPAVVGWSCGVRVMIRFPVVGWAVGTVERPVGQPCPGRPELSQRGPMAGGGWSMSSPLFAAAFSGGTS